MAQQPRLRVMRKSYQHADGTTSRSAKPGWAALHFDLFGTEKDDEGNSIVVDTVSFAKEKFPAEVLDAAAGHGLMQKLGDDAGAGVAKAAEAEGVAFDKKLGYSEFVKERLEELFDNMSNGIWVAERESGTGSGNVTILLQAITAAYVEAGRDIPEGLMDKLKNSDYREKARSIPAVKAHLDKIKLERAQERARKSAEANQANAGSEDQFDALEGVNIDPQKAKSKK